MIPLFESYAFRTTVRITMIIKSDLQFELCAAAGVQEGGRGENCRDLGWFLIIYFHSIIHFTSYLLRSRRIRMLKFKISFFYHHVFPATNHPSPIKMPVHLNFIGWIPRWDSNWLSELMLETQALDVPGRCFTWFQLSFVVEFVRLFLLIICWFIDFDTVLLNVWR